MISQDDQNRKSISSLQEVASANRVRLEMQLFKDGLEITDLFADEPGKGHGTTVMSQVVDFADTDGITVRLRPSSLRNHGFYARFDFVRDHQNYGFLVRYPQRQLSIW